MKDFLVVEMVGAVRVVEVVMVVEVVRLVEVVEVIRVVAVVHRYEENLGVKGPNKSNKAVGLPMTIRDMKLQR